MTPFSAAPEQMVVELTQVPPTHAWPVAHVAPQQFAAPQPTGEPTSVVSQPFACSVPCDAQWALPAAHVPAHAPAAQVFVARFSGLHTVPHPPQLLVSVCVATSQPSLALFALQSE